MEILKVRERCGNGNMMDLLTVVTKNLTAFLVHVLSALQ